MGLQTIKQNHIQIGIIGTAIVRQQQEVSRMNYIFKFA